MINSVPPCPFCGTPVDFDDDDTLYPAGVGWKFDEDFQSRTYHHITEIENTEQWCYGMHCTGCGAEITGDSKEEAIALWSTRVSVDIKN